MFSGQVQGQIQLGAIKEHSDNLVKIIIGDKIYNQCWPCIEHNPEHGFTISKRPHSSFLRRTPQCN